MLVELEEGISEGCRSVRGRGEVTTCSNNCSSTHARVCECVHKHEMNETAKTDETDRHTRQMRQTDILDR